MSVMGILAAIALPRYSTFVARQQLQAATRRVVADLAFAQRHARLTSTWQTIQFDSVAGKYLFSSIRDPNRVNQPYEVSLGAEPYRAKLVAASFGGFDKVTFDGYGYPAIGGTIVLGVGNLRQTITVENGTGKPRMAEIILVEAAVE